MKLLIVAATAHEIAPLQSLVLPQVSTLITGVGGVLTTFHLMQHLQQHTYDGIIQAGIAGSYKTSLALGQVVTVGQELFGDIGAEEKDGAFLDFINKPAFDLDEISAVATSLQNTFLSQWPIDYLSTVTGLTVNTASGTKDTIARRSLFGADIETMEGAAFHLVCTQYQQRFLQLRAISNYVTPRQISDWKKDLAIEQLNATIYTLIKTLNP